MDMKFTSQQSETISLGFLFPFKIASNLVEAFSLTREIKCQLLYEFLYHTKPSWLYSGTGGLILVQNSLIFRPLIFTDFSDHCPCPYCSSRAVTSAVSYHAWSQSLLMDPLVLVTSLLRSLLIIIPYRILPPSQMCADCNHVTLPISENIL